MESRTERALRLASLWVRKLRGKASAQDCEELARWAAESPDRGQCLERLEDPQYILQKRRLEADIDVEAAYAAFLKNRARRRGVWAYKKKWWMAAAAAALLLLALGLYGLRFRTPDMPQPLAQAELPQAASHIVPGSAQAVLTLAGGRQIALNKDTDTYLQLQDGNGAQASETSLVYEAAEAVPEEQAPVYNRLSVPRKGEFTLVLADGTRVTLNSESEIEYPTAFARVERRVRLKGEAYFQVAPAEAPFIIESGEVQVQVLGTEFNLRAYADEQRVQTTLVQGKVCMRTPEREVELAPHEQGSVDLTTGRLDKRWVDVQTYVGWKNGRFVFEKQRLEDIMKTLARWYGVEVVFKGASVKDIEFTGNLQRYDHFGQILSLLGLACPARFAVEGNTIYITE